MKNRRERKSVKNTHKRKLVHYSVTWLNVSSGVCEFMGGTNGTAPFDISIPILGPVPYGILSHIDFHLLSHEATLC